MVEHAIEGLYVPLLFKNIICHFPVLDLRSPVYTREHTGRSFWVSSLLDPFLIC